MKQNETPSNSIRAEIDAIQAAVATRDKAVIDAAFAELAMRFQHDDWVRLHPKDGGAPQDETPNGVPTNSTSER